jgi:hypothetical protein
MARDPEARRRAQQRYEETHRDEIRARGRAYQEARRRAAGIPTIDSPESSENRRRARKLRGSEHPNWKGDAVGYFALHAWLERNKPRTGICGQCGSKPESKKRTVATEWANVSGEYRRDLDDYIELCVSCHKRRDMTDQKRRKIGDASRGRPVSAETREKLRQATLRRWAKSRDA